MKHISKLENIFFENRVIEIKLKITSEKPPSL